MLLPVNILLNQVCQECFQYLSVLPVMINSRGDTICGRCFEDSHNAIPEAEKYTKSAYNFIADSFLFQCTNHLNGCTKMLSINETKKHEEMCNYKKQECFFCSFTGNLSQILNHSLKFHSENVSFDGTFSFRLQEAEFQKKFIIFKNDTIFHVTIDVTKDLFTAIITPAAKTIPSTINQYGIKFFRPDDPSNFDFIHTDYGLIDINLINYYKKNLDELITFFGSAQITCQILLGQFSLEEKEQEFQQRFAELRQSEAKLNNVKLEIQAPEQRLSQLNKQYNTAINIIKKMSYNLFKCSVCEKITFKDTYYCLNMHCYCQECLTNTCKFCETVREFKKLKDIDNFIVSCDWPGCLEPIPLKSYLEHRRKCSKRPYKCPLLECHEIILSAEKFIDHWHAEVPSLVTDDFILCDKYDCTEYYWLVDGDLYHVVVNFTENIIQVLITEVDVLQNYTYFKCLGIVGGLSKLLKSSSLCAKYHINIANSVIFHSAECNYRCTKIKISPN